MTRAHVASPLAAKLDADTARSPRTGLWGGRAIVLASVVIAVAVLLGDGFGMSVDHLGHQWQIIDLRVLSDDPLGGLWYMHTQPPGYNAIVGAVAWSPLPLAGTLYAINATALLAVGLLLHQLLIRLNVGSVVAGVVVAIALLNPSLISALQWAHYEILVAFTLVGALFAAQRYLDDPRPRWLFLLSTFVTLCGLIRSLFHPLWVIAAIALLVTIRPVPRRYVIAALGIPIVLLGGWTLKNQLVFGTPTTSSWLGFNLQRGVVAAMDEDDVREDVADGTVSTLALEYPWGMIEQYEPWIDSCEPHGHPATSLPEKTPYLGEPHANFNYECFIPVYQQAQSDAVRLVREHPGRYISTRLDGLVMSYQASWAGVPGDRTLIDRAYRPLLLATHVRVPQDDWNLPLLGNDDIPLDLSLTLVVCSLFVAVRGGVAAVRVARTGWRAREAWPTDELLWVLVAATAAFVIVGGGLVEFGENGRFRSSLDPLLLGLPLGWCAVAGQRWWARRAAASSQPAE